jgi:carboxypeptidase C (cathepsin A)
MPRTVLAALLVALAAAAAPLAAQQDPSPLPDEVEATGDAAPARATEEAGDETSPADGVDAGASARLPAPVATRHEIPIGGDALAFEAVAGAITLASPAGREEADIAYVAYLAEADDGAARPVTFAVNGGPGAASAYLHLGVLGPWRLPMDGASISPSQSIALETNPETWLAFTDLVFVDPVGTGFSRLVEPDDRLRGRYLSIDGDIEALADFVVRWLTQNGRLASPKYFIGESYGGFRGPRLAEALQTEHGVALAGMTLLSPVLDFGWWQQPGHNPLPAAALLPSLAAAAMERAGDYDAARLAEAEAYAGGDFVTDHLRGLADPEAVARMNERVTALTGLDPATVAEHAGRLDMLDLHPRALARRRPDRLALRRGHHQPRSRPGAPWRPRPGPGARRDDGTADHGHAGALPRDAGLAARPALHAAQPRRQPRLELGRRPRAARIGRRAPAGPRPRRGLPRPRRSRNGRPRHALLRERPRPAPAPRFRRGACARPPIAAGTCSTPARSPAAPSATTPAPSTSKAATDRHAPRRCGRRGTEAGPARLMLHAGSRPPQSRRG